MASPMNLGSRNTDASQINVGLGAQNTFFADIANPSGVAYDIDDIRARFRVANWGAQAGDSTVPGLWTQVPMDVPTVGDGLPRNGINFWGTKELIEFACPANTAGKFCNISIPDNTHQCMVVSLENVPGKPVRKITKASEYRNMNFITLSEQWRNADINVKGLQAILGNTNPRTVYTKAILRNMPEWSNTQVVVDGYLMNLLKLAVVGLGNIFNPFGGLSLAADDYMKAVWPTIEVHTYYETGRNLRVKGKTFKRLRAMNSFGYYASHDGVNYGYTFLIDDGVVGLKPEVKAGSKIWKHSIGNEQKITISTGITAQSTPRNGASLPTFFCQVFPQTCPQ